MTEFFQSVALMLVLLNPFLISLYLVDVLAKLSIRQFTAVLLRAGLIAAMVFCCFAVLGDAIFKQFVQAEFASFQIFGGIIFLLVGIQFVFQGPATLEMLRGESEYLAGAVAMPVLIGPGTISASMIVGKRMDPSIACLAVTLAIAISLITLWVLKVVHDSVRPRNERLVERYVETAGRVMALYVGTVAVEMIMRGLGTWFAKW